MQTDPSHTTPTCASRAFARGDADDAVSLAKAVAAAQCSYQSCIPDSAEFHAAAGELDRGESAFIAARPDSIAGALCKLGAVSSMLGVCAEDTQHPAIVLALACIQRAMRKLKDGEPDAMPALREAASTVAGVPWSDGDEPGLTSHGYDILCRHVIATIAGLARPHPTALRA